MKRLYRTNSILMILILLLSFQCFAQRESLPEQITLYYNPLGIEVNKSYSLGELKKNGNQTIEKLDHYNYSKQLNQKLKEFKSHNSKRQKTPKNKLRLLYIVQYSLFKRDKIIVLTDGTIYCNGIMKSNDDGLIRTLNGFLPNCQKYALFQSLGIEYGYSH